MIGTAQLFRLFTPLLFAQFNLLETVLISLLNYRGNCAFDRKIHLHSLTRLHPPYGGEALYHLVASHKGLSRQVILVRGCNQKTVGFDTHKSGTFSK